MDRKAARHQSTEEFESFCAENLRNTRNYAQSILDRAGMYKEAKNPTKLWQKVLGKLVLAEYHSTRYFDSARYPHLALVIRAAAKTQIVPRIEITVLADEGDIPSMEIKLSGKQPSSGKYVDVMTINLPKGSSDATRTSVVYWTAPLPGSRPYYEMMNSNFAEINNVIINSLAAIDRSLNK